MLPELYLARSYLFRGKARHISFIAVVSCAGIALGVATLIVVMSVMNGFDRDLTSNLMKFNYHLTIESYTNEDLAKVKDIVKAQEGVKSAEIFLQTQVFAKMDKVIFPLMVRGIDFSDKDQMKDFSQYIEKDNFGEGFFIGKGLEARFILDEKIEFYTLSKKPRLSQENIRGVFKADIYDIDNNVVVVDLEKAKSFSPNYIIRLGIKINDPFKAAILKEQIKKSVEKPLIITTWMQSNRALFSALKLEKIVMFIILCFIILVAAFNVFATLSVKVVEKTKDIGILRSLGFTSKKILTVFSLQGLLLGVIGTTCGAFLGLGLCVILERYPFIKLPEDIYYIKYLPVAINYGDIFLIMFVGLFLSYVFSLFPALRASRLSAAEALRYE